MKGFEEMSPVEFDVHGKFKEKRYIGERITVYSFDSMECGALEIGVYNTMGEPPLDSEYQIRLMLHGKVRDTEQGPMYRNHLYVKSYKSVE